MARLAWFSPLPPVRSGIAQYSRELLSQLVRVHEIDLFVDRRRSPNLDGDARLPQFDAHDFVWKRRREQYDLIVYQMGNAACHDYMWAYLLRYPGLVVLHDGQLHHARARFLLQQERYDDYRREFRFNHPDANVDVPELGAEGLLGSLTYLWPMLRTVVESSRGVAVHNSWLAEQIRDAHPASNVELVDMGVREPLPTPGAHEQIRSRHGMPPDAVVFTAFGKVTAEKRIRETIRALAALKDDVPGAHLLLAGEPTDHYDPLADARTFHVEDRVSVAGFVPDNEIDNYLSASDVCVCLRWPSSRETSASWLRCIAAGRTTITTDLVHTADVPALDPRSWTMPQRADGAAPVTVSIDILDEDHSLGLAMRRLATDARLRETIGANARRLWAGRYRLEMMGDRYLDLITTAIGTPIPDALARAGLPNHLQSNGTEHAKALLRAAGLGDAERADLWSGRNG